LCKSKWKGREGKGKGKKQKLTLLALTRRSILRFLNASILFEEEQFSVKAQVASSPSS